MIIKVVELVKTDGYASLDKEGKISNSRCYSLCEAFLNTEHIVSFREVAAEHYREQDLPEDLDDRQSFTYVTLSEVRKGITVVGSPAALQHKINAVLNCFSSLASSLASEFSEHRYRKRETLSKSDVVTQLHRIRWAWH